VDFATAEALCLHGGVPAKRKNPTIGRVLSRGLGAYQASPERGAATVGETTTGGDQLPHD